MANASARKGTRTERELIHLLGDAGWATMRCPASGGATTTDLPDLLALRNAVHIDGSVYEPVHRSPRSVVYAIEAKASKTGSVRLKHDEVFALCRFAVLAGAFPLVAVRPDRQPWSFFEPRELTVSDNSRGVTQGMLQDSGWSFEEVFGG